MWPFDIIDHWRDCKRKQDERASRIATLPAPYLSPLSPAERGFLGAPIEQLVQDVNKGVTSPVDILRAYGKVAVKAHEATNCVTEVMMTAAEDWIEQGQINIKGPLAGIPVSLKDSIVVGGFDTSVGYSSKCGKPWAKDGAMVRMLKEAGAVPFVKTALPISLLSFESTNDVWGQAKNPHNPKYSPGGSTGGEGALLAFGGSRIGIGSDVAGSVRAPAHFSGCYSLRCSTGRWPKLGMDTSMPGQEGIPSVFSPMTRTLGDLTYFTRAMIQCKPWTYDNTVHPIPWRSDSFTSTSEKKKLRIGVLRSDGVVDPSPACSRALQTAVSALESQGHSVFDITPPPTATPYEALVIASQLLNADGTAQFRSFFRTGERTDPGAAQLTFITNLFSPLRYLYYLYLRYVKGDSLWAGLIRDMSTKSALENWQLVARREAFKTTWFNWWNDLNDSLEGEMDVLLTVPNATPALPHGAMADAVSSCGYTFLFNLLDYTAGVMPVAHVDAEKDKLPNDFYNGKQVARTNGVARGAYKHYDAVAMHGLPVAVQVVGRRLEEEKVLAVMERIEGALEERGEKYQLLEVA